MSGRRAAHRVVPDARAGRPRRAATPRTRRRPSAASSSARASPSSVRRSSSMLRLPARDRREDLRVAAHRVAAGRLDLQHLGAEVGEDLGGVRHRPPHRQIQHPHPREQPRHGRIFDHARRRAQPGARCAATLRRAGTTSTGTVLWCTT